MRCSELLRAEEVGYSVERIIPETRWQSDTGMAGDDEQSVIYLNP